MSNNIYVSWICTCRTLFFIWKYVWFQIHNSHVQGVHKFDHYPHSKRHPRFFFSKLVSSSQFRHEQDKWSKKAWKMIHVSNRLVHLQEIPDVLCYNSLCPGKSMSWDPPGCNPNLDISNKLRVDHPLEHVPIPCDRICQWAAFDYKEQHRTCAFCFSGNTGSSVLEFDMAPKTVDLSGNHTRNTYNMLCILAVDLACNIVE